MVGVAMNGLKSNIGYQKWLRTFLRYYREWNNRLTTIISYGTPFSINADLKSP
jgi:hypothetical protein